MLDNAIFSRLTSGSVQDIGDRVYPWGRAPENPQAPYILYQQMSAGLDNRGFTGKAKYFRTLQQVDIFAKTKTQVELIATGIRALLDGVDDETNWGGETIVASRLDDEFDSSFEDEVNLVRVIQQYRIVTRKE